MYPKLLLLLVLVPLATCQLWPFGGFHRFFSSRPRTLETTAPARAPVDARRGGSEYHYSWRHDGGRQYRGHEALAYCRRLGGGWQAISVETQQESQWLNGVVAQQRQQYIWTSGSKSGSSWRWATGAPVAPLNWSPTGGFRTPQPDDREGREDCLAVLNNFYRDGIRWHDIACRHKKPIVCERKA